MESVRQLELLKVPLQTFPVWAQKCVHQHINVFLESKGRKASPKDSSLFQKLCIPRLTVFICVKENWSVHNAGGNILVPFEKSPYKLFYRTSACKLKPLMRNNNTCCHYIHFLINLNSYFRKGLGDFFIGIPISEILRTMWVLYDILIIFY